MSSARTEPTDGAECLIIVPREETDLYEKLAFEFANDSSVEVRLDGRAGRSRVLQVVVVERRALSADLRARIENVLERAAAAAGPPGQPVSG